MVSLGSVYASPRFLRFRDPENFFAGNLRGYLSYWEVVLRGYSKEEEIYSFVSEGVKAHNFFVPFHGSFQGRSFFLCSASSYGFP